MTLQITSRRIFTIKEAADRVGVYPFSIVRAERAGRIPPARRDEVGHRVYDDHDVEVLRGAFGRASASADRSR